MKFFRILGWAFYLASSWTWCIGMFLPVLLIRDYGVCGWVVFAVPNILGATAMAYILAKPEMSKEIVEKHKIACNVFSIVTILFQVFFITWISQLVSVVFMVIVGVVLSLIYVFSLTFDKNQLFGAFIAWALSLSCFVLILNIIPVENLNFFKSENLNYKINSLLYLTPVCFFGFMLCPYLDLTLHKAKQSNNELNSKIIFTIGFCFLFFVMLLMTLFYANPMINIIKGIPYFLNDQKQLPLMYVYAVVFHMLIQAGFTTMLHFKAVFPPLIFKRNNLTSLFFAVLSVAVFLLPIIFDAKYTFLNISINEIIYRSFMVFYGLIAPAYVLLFMIPKKKKSVSLNSYNLLIWIIGILLALPFYAIAFLGVKWNLEFWLLIGLIIALCPRRFIKTYD